MHSLVSQWSLDDRSIPTLASLVPSPNHAGRRWPSELMVDKAKPRKARRSRAWEVSVANGPQSSQPMVAKAKPPKTTSDRSGPRWDRQAVKATAAAVALLQRTDPERLRKAAEKAAWRAERDRMAKTPTGRWELAKLRREFVGPPTLRQWASMNRQTATRKVIEAKQAHVAARVSSAPPAPPVPTGPSEAELAARRAKALAGAAALVALMRAPRPT